MSCADFSVAVRLSQQCVPILPDDDLRLPLIIGSGVLPLMICDDVLSELFELAPIIDAAPSHHGSVGLVPVTVPHVTVWLMPTTSPSHHVTFWLVPTTSPLTSNHICRSHSGSSDSLSLRPSDG